jgi:hypothetical protein
MFRNTSADKVAMGVPMPSTPSSMNRCCQRQTQVFDVPV